MVSITGLAHLRVLCKKTPKPSLTELQKRFEAMQQHDKAAILHNPQCVSRRLDDDKADDTCIINSLHDFLSQTYILENDGVLITHLLDEWERPLTHPLKFKGDGRNRLFQRFCANHPSDFEVFTWQDENDSVRGTTTT
jgi:hypothetical protein